MADNTDHIFRVGNWLPQDRRILNEWVHNTTVAARAAEKPLLPVIQNFRSAIELDPELYMLFSLMLAEVPFPNDPTGVAQIRDFDTLLIVLNHIMTEPPPYNETGLVGFPINAILDYSMGTTAGFAAFLNSKVNAQLKILLNEWAIYLRSPDSCSGLNTTANGWFGPSAMKKMFNDPETHFENVFQCDPLQPHYGFKSWDDFFTRQFKEGQRPLANPEDDTVIVNACESAPYRIAHNVSLVDNFWIKGQPYSLSHILNNDSMTHHFDQGTVYQAFLSALSYHRWHSPVSGTIIKTQVVDGTYYSEARCVGFDQSAPNESQGYITEVATRALIFIEADNKDIGLMCFVAVGMAEVSTCDITVYQGQHVTKGDQIGMFHFGGSTHCLIFRPSVQLEFDKQCLDFGLNSKNIQLKQRIATVLN